MGLERAAIMYATKKARKALSDFEQKNQKPLPSVSEIREYLDTMSPQLGNPNNHQIELVLTALKAMSHG